MRSPACASKPRSAFPLALGWLVAGAFAAAPSFGTAPARPRCLSPPVWSRRRRCCCSPRPRGACDIRPRESSSSSPRRCNSCARCGFMPSHSPRAHAIAFGAIWTALALYMFELIRAPRACQPPDRRNDGTATAVRIANAMKRLLLVGAAALLLAACDTSLYGQPYPPGGQPYPPSYPGDAYPPTPYPEPGYPPPGYPPQNQYSPGPQLACPF